MHEELYGQKVIHFQKYICAGSAKKTWGPKTNIRDLTHIIQEIQIVGEKPYEVKNNTVQKMEETCTRGEVSRDNKYSQCEEITERENRKYCRKTRKI